MERALRDYCERMRAEQTDRLNGMLGLELVACDRSEKRAVFALEPRPWMVNSLGVLHGGVLAAAMDVSLGMLCRYFSNSAVCPTAHLDMNYLFPAPAADLIEIRVRLLRAGLVLCVAAGEAAARRNPQQILVSATGSYCIGKRIGKKEKNHETSHL